MIYRIFFLGTTLVLLPGCSLFQADPAPSPRTITVSGMATIKAPPDEMKWAVQIAINEDTQDKAKAKHDVSLQGLLDYLKSLDSSITNLQMGGIRISKQVYASRNEKPFICSTTLKFRLTDFDKYSDITDHLAHIEGLQIQSIEYDYSKEQETRKEARVKALHAAREKAVAMAGALDASVGQPLHIREEDVDSTVETTGLPGKGLTESEELPGGPSTVPGEVEVAARCEVEFELK